jgi:hypothetical protein
VVLLLEKYLVAWSLAIDERDGHNDLRDSGHRSIISYVHGRTELYCTSPSCLSLTFFRPREVAPARAFYSSRSDNYIETRSLIGGPELVETLYNI